MTQQEEGILGIDQGGDDTVQAVQFVPATPAATAYAARQTTEDGKVRVMIDPCGRIAGFTFRDERGRCMWRAFPGFEHGVER
ncbi:MAG: hypothetical protein H6742_09715 [Alphaproteobacteria bacterium]|nr:hypothetical protein [Alphaproteobacteria bacterium]